MCIEKKIVLLFTLIFFGSFRRQLFVIGTISVGSAVFHEAYSVAVVTKSSVYNTLSRSRSARHVRGNGRQWLEKLQKKINK